LRLQLCHLRLCALHLRHEQLLLLALRHCHSSSNLCLCRSAVVTVPACAPAAAAAAGQLCCESAVQVSDLPLQLLALTPQPVSLIDCQRQAFCELLQLPLQHLLLQGYMSKVCVCLQLRGTMAVV
jgi:hypothetical protein